MKSELVISKSELVISKSELTISKMSFEHFPNYCDERLVRIQFCFCLLNGDEAGGMIFDAVAWSVCRLSCVVCCPVRFVPCRLVIARVNVVRCLVAFRCSFVVGCSLFVV